MGLVLRDKIKTLTTNRVAGREKKRERERDSTREKTFFKRKEEMMRKGNEQSHFQ